MDLLNLLPQEIMIKILSSLPSIDLIQFLRAYEEYLYFLRERRVIQFISFKNMFELSNLDICRFISTNNIAYNYIKVLNIDCLYWIPVQDIRKLLLELKMLEELYAVDTKLGVRKKDILLYGRLKKLSVSAEGNQFNNNESSNFYVNYLYGLQKLCLKIISKKDDNFDELYFFFGALKYLTELWICDNDEQYGINYKRIILNLPNLNKFVLKSKRPIPVLDLKCWGLHKIFQNNGYDFAVEGVFERISAEDIKEPNSNPDGDLEPVDRSWEILKSLHCEMPWGPKDFQAIYLNNSIKDVYFEDLNFCHSVMLCNLKYISAAVQILASKNSVKLRRLSFRSCLFQVSDSEIKPNDEQISFKKVRKEVPTNCTNHPFENIANHLNNLRELEILICPRCNEGALISSAYPLIGMLENLQKLTLEIPLLIDGSFLKEVFIQCKHLESLSITCLAQNDKFVLNLCQNLQYTSNLRDFKLYHKEITIDKILNTFNDLSHKKLLRIFFKCDNLGYAYVRNETEPFATFMENNPQVIFFFAVISNNTVKQNSDIQKTLNTFRNGNPAKIFYVKKDASSFSGNFPIPSAHHDMVLNYTNVSIINLNQF